MRSIARNGWVAAVVLGLAATSSAGETPIKGPWDGFGVGSWVTSKDSTAMAGMPAQSTETKQTLVKVTDAEYVISMEMKMGDMAMPAQEVKIPRIATGSPTTDPKAVVEDLGKEKVTVDGSDYECVKKKTTLDGNATTTWTHDKHGVLKFEGSTANGGTTAMVVVKLSAKTTVAGKELECRQTKTSVKMMGADIETMAFECDGVPGRATKSEMTMKQAGMETKRTSEVIAFEAK
jgi:hypothetical protein